MSEFKKSDLQYNDYSWKVISGDNPRMTGSPDNDLLNRMEGYEILDFINTFLENFSMFSIENGQRIERMIRSQVPENYHSRLNISIWIEKNWDDDEYFDVE